MRSERKKRYVLGLGMPGSNGLLSHRHLAHVLGNTVRKKKKKTNRYRSLP